MERLYRRTSSRLSTSPYPGRTTKILEYSQLVVGLALALLGLLNLGKPKIEMADLLLDSSGSRISASYVLMSSNWLIPTITLTYFLLLVGQKVIPMRLFVYDFTRCWSSDLRTGCSRRSRWSYEPGATGRRSRPKRKLRDQSRRGPIDWPPFTPLSRICLLRRVSSCICARHLLYSHLTVIPVCLCFVGPKASPFQQCFVKCCETQNCPRGECRVWIIRVRDRQVRRFTRERVAATHDLLSY